MLQRRDFLAGASAFFLAPRLASAQVAPPIEEKAFRIVVVANTYHEGDGLMAAFAMRMPRNPKVDVPRAILWPRQWPKPKEDPHPFDARPRAVIDVTSLSGKAKAVVEIWCLDDLMNSSIPHGNSDNKETALQLIDKYMGPDGAAKVPAPDAVVAFGTAGYPDAISYDGCATIGGTIYIRDAKGDGPGEHSNWTWDNHMDQLIPSKIPTKFFTSVALDAQTIRTINSQMLVPPINPSSKPRVIIAADAVAISSVNIPKDSEYGPIDSRAVEGAKSKGATNIVSVETTHGVIRAHWPDAPFIFVTAIPNRIGHFADEAMGNYTQELSSSHNAGIALQHVLPFLVENL